MHGGHALVVMGGMHAMGLLHVRKGYGPYGCPQVRLGLCNLRAYWNRMSLKATAVVVVTCTPKGIEFDIIFNNNSTNYS